MNIGQIENEEECNCNVGITNVFHKGKCIKCKKKVIKHKPTIGASFAGKCSCCGKPHNFNFKTCEECGNEL